MIGRPTIAHALKPGNAINIGYPAGATFGTSLREAPGYIYSGPLIRVRRASDNNEANFYQGLTPGTLNTVRGGSGISLQTWANGNSYIKTYYDITGNGNHATQTNALMQNQITDGSGAILTAGGKIAALSYAGNSYDLTTSLDSAEPFTFCGVGKKNNATDNLMWLAGNVGGFKTIAHYSNQKYFIESSVGITESTNTYSNTDLQIIIGNVSNISRSQESNSISIPSSVNANGNSVDFNLFGGLHNFGNGTTGYISEFIFWPLDKATDIPLIRSAANQYYAAF